MSDVKNITHKIVIKERYKNWAKLAIFYGKVDEVYFKLIVRIMTF